MCKKFKINQISPSFCAAKWLQTTIDLTNGTTHSCHHPIRHRIDFNELKSNPSALHNTQIKKNARKEMLKGIRPKECSYCWEIEDSSQDVVSDRIIKTTDDWAWPLIDKLAALNPNDNVIPTYLELMITDACQCSCIYCLADISTSVAAEIKQFGPYPSLIKEHNLLAGIKLPQNEPLTAQEKELLNQSFWKWLPEIFYDLKVLRITGGEPFLSPDFELLLTFLEQNSNPNLVFIINSNLVFETNNLKSIFLRLYQLEQNKKIHHWELYTSCESTGPQAEYIRHGLKYQQWKDNLILAQNYLSSPVIVMATLNILSLPNLKEFLLDVLELKKNKNGCVIDASYLKNLDCLRLDIATNKMIDEFISIYEWMKTQNFSAHEIQKIQNIVSWVKSQKDSDFINKSRAAFFLFIREFSKRKNKDFVAIFPQLKDFFFECKTKLLDFIP